MTENLTLSAPANLRDLGGIPAVGGTVRRGVAIRADDLSLTPREDAETLIADGLAAVIDLRTPGEVRNTGRGVFGELPVAYHHLPLMPGLRPTAGPGSGVDPRDPVGMGGMYADLFSTAAGQIVTALAVLAVTPGATAFHCSAGKDRTGVLAAAFLLALGADDDDVVADYAVTGTNIAAVGRRLQPLMGAILASHGVNRNTFTRSAIGQDFSAVAMETALATLRQRHGDPLRPLREAGLGDELVAMLRRRAVDPA
ncbi:tyrosine-protein phosphatase [Trujillonella endophytica]|uniref:Tyrosine phosphatase family protein n=1 Tax=Trujillonella endophytica TaxID=673521 RepID=A0A1H8W4C1_9ACTN|nr:tyrosine-protein phosphatase [Trujillella endophytica]SEP22393.1 Tyrosine phosphatase family protein [Trujillella endophytica]